MGLKVSQLISGYRQTPVLHEVSFEMQVGQTVALLGLNGAGKSTLLKTILGLLPAQSGSVSIGCLPGDQGVILQLRASFARPFASFKVRVRSHYVFLRQKPEGGLGQPQLIALA